MEACENEICPSSPQAHFKGPADGPDHRLHFLEVRGLTADQTGKISRDRSS
jgi:hypothetical protein